MGIPAPVIVAEQADHTALGGGNSGICGDLATHFYGFHLDANSVGSDDYSRWRDPNGADGPYVNWSYCCAGDFRHGGNEQLRAMHRTVLARLMAGELPMICEFIGQPWSDRPVYYWARWNGVANLQRYTGTGHDLWSHISWYRSMADQRAFLWRPSTPSTVEEDMAEVVREPNGGVWKLDAKLEKGLPVLWPVGDPHVEWPALNNVLGPTRQLGANIDWRFAIRGDLMKPAPVPVDITDADAEQIADKVIASTDKPLTDKQTEDAAFRGAQRAETQ